MDPWILLRWPVFWLRFWLKRVGPKWVFGGMAVSTVLAIVLNHYL